MVPRLFASLTKIQRGEAPMTKLLLLETSCPMHRTSSFRPPVRNHLPSAAQDIYRETFNHAWQTYGSESRREEIAHRVAWAAVKHRYQKGADGDWRPRE